MLIVVPGPQRLPSGGAAEEGSGVPNDPHSYRGKNHLQWPHYDNGYTHTHTHTHILTFEGNGESCRQCCSGGGVTASIVP